MIKKVIMKNLICTGCAAKIEKSLTRLSYIHTASFNFPNQTMVLDVDEDAYDETHSLKEIKSIVDSIETGVITMPYEQRHEQTPISFLKTYKFVILGILIFIGGYGLDYFDLLTPRLNVLYWAGYALIAHKIIYNTYKGLKRKEMFNENMLMFVATFAAMLIEKPFEAALVILFYSIGEHLQHKAVEQSKKEVSSLMDLHVDFAHVIENGETITKDPMSIKRGDRILVKNGEKIPVDGVIVKGTTSLNTSALTGESALKNVDEGAYILSGNINVGNVIEIKAHKEYKESTISRIIDLIENATNKKAKTEQFITRFAKYYTPAVTFLALVMVTVPTIFNPHLFDEYVFRAATFLVISCPCALVLSIPLSYFAGIGVSAKHGILYKGSNFLDSMCDVDTIGIDKTGTLTHGNFEVAGYTNLTTLKIAASIENYSNHPIAKSIVFAFPGTLENFDKIEEIPGKGMKAIKNDTVYLVGSRELLVENNIENVDKKDTAGTNVFVSKNGTYVGRVVVKDAIRMQAKQTIGQLKKRASITMLTGDNADTASEVAFEVGNIGYKHSLLPEDKINEFEKLKNGKKSMYVGDGINDAPLLKAADIGVAMGQGSELAIDVADVIIMDDDLSMLEKAFDLAAKTKRIVIQNIVISLGVKFLFLGLATVGRTTMLMAIFADVGITLIAVLNSLRLIYRKGGKSREVKHAH